MRRGEGALIEDVDGNRYVDWVQSWGPLLFGHADPETLAAVHEAVDRGHDVRRADRGRGRARRRDRRRRAVDRDGAARLLRHRGVDERPPARARGDAAATGDQVRRLLPRPRRRAARERRLGPDDARDPVDPGRARRASPPTRSSAASTTSTASPPPCAQYGEGLAAILVEPVAGNMGFVPPAPGFLEALRALCDATGALLVFDEVITGFRVARGGAQERYGVTARPDDPRQDRRRRPARRGVRRPGRADGAPRARRRRLPGRDALRESARDRRRHLGAAPAARPGRLRGARAARRAARGRASRRFGTVQRVGAMLTLFCRDEPVARLRGRRRSDTERYGALFRHLLERGVYLPPSQFECMFVSLAHGDERGRRDDRGRCELVRRERRRPWRRLPRIADGAAAESPLWAESLRPVERARARARLLARSSPTSASRSASRRSTRATSSTTAGRGSSLPPDDDIALLLGDSLSPTVSCASPRRARRRPCATSPS